MALIIPRDMQKMLPPRVRTDLAEQSEEKQQIFADLYKRKTRNKALMVVLSIFFPIQLFFLGKIGLGILFLLTAGGLGIWWIIEWFTTSSRVDTFNEILAEELLAEIRLS